jgi:hypothetical protein
MPTTILHLISAEDYQNLGAGQDYLPKTYVADGFIHCTKEPEVMLQIANRFYKSLPGTLFVLLIDADLVKSPIKWEAPAHPDGSPAQPGERLFPHIYGPLNREAIVAVRTASRDSDGTFLSV